MVIMRILEKWGIAATFVCGGLLFLACANNDNSAPDTSALDLWQAGKTVTTETVTAYGGIDKCFAAEPIPDGVWQRMQGATSAPCTGTTTIRCTWARWCATSRLPSAW